MEPKDYRRAEVRWNGGRGALLCAQCRRIIAEGFDHKGREHRCDDCAFGDPKPIGNHVWDEVYIPDEDEA
jgi:ribosomal protein L37AE/L43A